jgi:hypothetical protein
MTCPGSMNLDRIRFASLRYLTNETVSAITEEYFNLETGKPRQNLSRSEIVDTFFTNVASNLKENKNINENFIYKYPKVLEVDSLRDIQVTDETSISVVFLLQGASMKNMFGYYMYYVDEEGNKQLLSNSDDTGGYYYAPTVIYPYVYSDPLDSNTLQNGQVRRLIGNLPNGNFSNIWIGFFLIPHGWFAYKMNSEIYDHNILHSTIEFNTPYTKTDYQMVNDKIYSVYARAVDDKGNDLLFTAFEDVFIDGVYDLDYNDCVVGFIISDTKNIKNYNDYSCIDVKEPNDDDDEKSESSEDKKNNIVCLDDDGEYIRIRKSHYDINDKHSHRFERHMYFDNIDDRDQTFDACNELLANYKYEFEKRSEDNKYVLALKYLFRHNDLKKGDRDNDYRIYLFESVFSNHLNPTIVNKYKEMTFKNMHNSNYYEKYKLIDTVTDEELIRLTDTFDQPLKSQENKFRIIGNGVMDCQSGKSHLPADKSQIYNVYKNMSGDKGIVINVKMDTHPTGYMNTKKTFVRYVSFVANTNEHLVIDLGNLNMYQEVDDTLNRIYTPSFDNIKVSGITTDASSEIKSLINVLKNDSGASFRTVTINGMQTYYCIRFANIKNIPTMVFLDSTKSLEWNNKYNSTSGTYYDKQTTYPVSSFKSI